MTAYTAYSIIEQYNISVNKTIIEINKTASMIGIKIKK